MFAKVLLPISFDYPFDYKIPNEISNTITKNQLVLVNFRNKQIVGLVLDVVKFTDIDSTKIREILKIEEIPQFSENFVKFLSFVSEYNMIKSGEVLKMAINTIQNGVKTHKILPQEFSGRFNLEKLSTKQLEIKDAIYQKILENKFSVNLIEGVTGSGKTEIYFHLIAEILQNESDSQILIILPEIALTSQFLARFSKQFGFTPVSWHSDIGVADKRNIFFSVVYGNIRILVGARSALFLPFKNLRLVIVDEEHDSSFKQEMHQIYHGRDMAIMRANFENFPVILLSATPSIETHVNVMNGKYEKFYIDKRYGKSELPSIELVDMRKQKLQENHNLSQPLIDKIKEILENRLQIAIYINRRGYAPITLCKKCGNQIQCQNCSCFLTYHKNRGILLCHHCGYNEKFINHCRNCNNEGFIMNNGIGAERVFEEVEKYFPNSRVLLITSDTISSGKKLEEAINKILNHEIDIIIGTQIIAKGHDFPKLNMVAILDGDMGVYGTDIRSNEKAYQIISQISGRAGRRSEKGCVLIQTYNPDNQILKMIINNEKEKFIEAEIALRQRMLMPPFANLALVSVSNIKEDSAMKDAKKLASYFPNDKNIEILGPSQAPLARLKNKYRFHIIVKTPKNFNIQKLLRDVIVKSAIKSDVKVDVNPYNFA